MAAIAEDEFSEMMSNIINGLCCVEGIEPKTREFSAADRVFQEIINRSLKTLAIPLPRHTNGTR